MKDILNYSLLGHNTFGMDVKCARFVEFSTPEELGYALGVVRGQGRPLLVIGGGSNLLFTRDFDGVVLHSAIMGCSPAPSADGTYVDLRCGSGEKWDDVVSLCVEKGWHGMENLSYIPGEVGASAVQNIGAYGVEVKDLIVGVEAMEVDTGRIVAFGSEECGYGYRSSRFKREWKGRYVVTHVTYRLDTRFRPHLDYGNIRQSLQDKGIDVPTPRQLRDVVIGIRRSKLPEPGVLGNAGSFFMNPIVPVDSYRALAASYPGMPHYVVDEGHVKVPAGWLIENCGWKGKAMGNVAVHDKQSLVLVNLGGAKGSDVVALCERICGDVRDRFGINITPEVNIID